MNVACVAYTPRVGGRILSAYHTGHTNVDELGISDPRRRGRVLPALLCALCAA